MYGEKWLDRRNLGRKTTIGDKSKPIYVTESCQLMSFKPQQPHFLHFFDLLAELFTSVLACREA